jgi:thiamine phosphate synthase YjbQ (UPF0047 family)
VLDRLYCPDFSALFGSNFRNPYEYPLIDSLVWPSLVDLETPPETVKLFALVKGNSHPLFYRRKITVNQLVIELKASGLQGACLQALELGREYGIPSETVIKAVKKYPEFFYAILSPRITADGLEALKKHIKFAVAIVIYPSYQNLDLVNTSPDLDRLCQICEQEGLPLKIDLGNMYLPDNNLTLVTPDKIRTFASKHYNLKIVLSGIDMLGNGPEMLNIVRYERNVNVEFDPRTFGGTTPVEFFSKVFAIPGLIQNAWDKILLGSSTPMLESSQITRGWWNATEKLPFNLQSLLRTWMYRNVHRIYRMPCKPESTIAGIIPAPYATFKPARVIQKSDNELFILQDLELNSFAITQLLFISPYILEAAKQWTQEFKDYPFGEFTLKSYHTTTSIIVNEHEHGNFLQLHYQFAEATMSAAEDKLHTVAADENRADFNYPDHILASSVGDKDLTVPIVDGKIQLGGRENLYILVTFGPRGLKLSLTFKLFKGTSVPEKAAKT